MHRATITLPDGLDAEVERFRAAQPARPSLTSVIEAALEDYLRGSARVPAGSTLLTRVMRLRPEIRRIAAEHGAHTVRLFGSVARGEDGTASDLDLLVDVEPGTTLFDLAAMRSHLERLLDAPVDVVPSSSVDAATREHLLVDALTL